MIPRFEKKDGWNCGSGPGTRGAKAPRLLGGEALMRLSKKTKISKNYLNNSGVIPEIL